MAAIRKASGSLKRDEPASKKQRTSVPSKSQTSTSAVGKSSLNDALFAQGAPKKLEATAASRPHKKSSHTVQDAKSAVTTVVGQKTGKKPIEVVEISSDDSSEDESEEEAETAVISTAAGAGEEESNAEDSAEALTTVIAQDNDTTMAHEDDDEDDAPTFGELLAPAPIDVQTLMTTDDADGTITSRQMLSSTTTSLATVLTQALKTNDRQLLESCFLTNDLESVRATIARLPSNLVGQLLLYIADKLHTRPGRASNLIVWVQWSLVSHGGYLARREDVVKKLSGLNRVMKERANALQPLLALKGRLDMLSAQVELRRLEMKSRTREVDEEEDVPIYVEGQEDVLALAKAEDDSEEDDDDSGEDDDQMVLDEAAIAAAAQELEADEDADSDDAVDSDEEASDAGFSDQELEEDSEPSVLDDSDEEEVLEVIRPDKGKKRKA